MEVVRWLVVFESGTGFCYDDASCAARAARDPNATSSQFYPSTLLPDGTLIPFAEVNPNVRGCDVGPLPRPHPPSPAQPAPHAHRFLPGIRVAQLYKSIAVFVPDCSGDLFAGNVSRASASHSRGLAIAQAVLEDLQATSPSVLDADALTLFGPTGLVAHADRVPGWLALGQRKNQSLTAVCDGCLLLGNFTSPIVPSPPCATDRDCPVAIALPRALSYWQAPAPTSCSTAPSDLAACFLDTAVLRSASIAAVPILVQQPQFDALQLAPLVRAWPPAMTDPATRTLVVSFQKRVRQLLASTAYAFSAACDAPTGLAVDPAYYHISVRARFGTQALTRRGTTEKGNREEEEGGGATERGGRERRNDRGKEQGGENTGMEQRGIGLGPQGPPTPA